MFLFLLVYSWFSNVYVCGIKIAYQHCMMVQIDGLWPMSGWSSNTYQELKKCKHHEQNT